MRPAVDNAVVIAGYVVITAGAVLAVVFDLLSIAAVLLIFAGSHLGAWFGSRLRRRSA